MEVLLRRFERCYEACSQMDAHRANIRKIKLYKEERIQAAASRLEYKLFDKRLRLLEAAIDKEVDRVTAERLILDVQRKMERKAS